MNLLVTGGCGFIGSHFIEKWLARPGAASGDRLINLDLLTYAGNPANVTAVADDERHVFVQGDIGDEPLVAGLLAQHQVDAIVHFAAESHVDRSIDSPAPFVRTNVVGTESLLSAARRHCATPARAQTFRFLHVSTDEVFGDLRADTPPATETSPYAPRSPYAASKAAADHLVRAYGHTYGLPVLLTYCCNNYGPRQFPEKLIPLAIHRALTGGEIPVYGDGLHVREWLHVHDHVDALLRVLHEGRPGQSYAISSRESCANLELLQLLCRLLDRKRPLAAGRSYAEQLVPVADRPGHDRRYALDPSRMGAELGWRASHGLAAGLDSTVDWYLTNPEWTQKVMAHRYGGERLGTGKISLR